MDLARDSGESAPMDQSEKIRAALAFGEKLLGLAIDKVGAVNLPLSPLGARDPKIVSLALLCRTISNFKGAMIIRLAFGN